MLSVGMTLAVCCYLSGYNPVLRSQAHSGAAEQEMFSGRQSEAEAELGAAAAADPLAAEPWRQLAALTFADWRRDRRPETYQRFTQCMTTALGQRLIRPPPGWRPATDTWKISAQRGPAEALTPGPWRPIAVRWNCIPTTPAAMPSWRWPAKRRATAPWLRREARTALRLDQLTPHEDKKLPAELREKLGKCQGLEIGN